MKLPLPWPRSMITLLSGPQIVARDDDAVGADGLCGYVLGSVNVAFTV